MSDNDGRTNPWHWYEYEVGLAGEVARACFRCLAAFLIGLGCAFALIMGTGILAEENLLGDPGLAGAIDHLSRMSAGVLLAFVLVAWAAFAVADFVREVTTSRAIVRAAARGASRHEVPSPEQVESVSNEPARQLSFFGWANAALSGLLGVVGMIVVLAEGDEPEGLLISSVALGYALITALLGFAGPKWLTPVHERRRAAIAAHWSAEDEGKAWRPAKQPRRDETGKKPSSGFSVSARFVYGAAVLAVLGFVALEASVTMRCGQIPGQGGNECDEVTYSSFIEQILAWGFWIFAVLTPLALLLAVIGVLLDWRQRRSERAELRAALADPYSPRPAENLLVYHARRRMHPLALVGAAMSGIGLVFSTSAYLVGTGQGLGSQDVFAAYLTETLAAIAVSVGLFVAALLGTGFVNVRGRELRNELMRRWPTLPSWSANGEGKVLRAKRGPALRGGRYVKVGKNASSDRN